MKCQSVKKKSQKEQYSLLKAIAVVTLAFLPFVHDFELFKGKEGFSGFPSLRIGIWVVSMFLIAISGWVLAFARSKGRSDRFSILAPIIMLVFQLIVYVFNERDSSLNEFNVKVMLNFGFLLLIVITYFLLKTKKKGNE